MLGAFVCNDFRGGIASGEDGHGEFLLQTDEANPDSSDRLVAGDSVSVLGVSGYSSSDAQSKH